MESKIKRQLRPIVRRLRAAWSKPPFRVRHWVPRDGPSKIVPAETGPIRFDLLWQTYPPRYRRLTIDESFVWKSGYPLPDRPAIPLIDVFTAGAEKYLSVSHCPVTGLVFHQSLPSPAWLHRYYATEWDHGAGNDQSTPAEILHSRPNKVQRLLEARGVSVGSRVLDIGCGYGDQLWHFRQKGHEVVGIEPSMHRAEVASRLIEAPVVNSPIEGVSLERILPDDRKFDLIYLNQVLEHLDRPLNVLCSLRSCLKPGGKLLIGVPELFAESMSFFTFSITHTHSFSAPALRNLLRLAGFRPKEDLSFPGYCYMLFEDAGGATPALEDPLTAEVVNYAYAHFDVLGRRSGEGLISVESTYLGLVDIGLKPRSLPPANQLERLRRAIHGRDAGELGQAPPVQIFTQFPAPVVWHK